MPNNNDQPDINKAIDVCMEEYKTLRAQILETIQNRTNVIVFGGGLVLTLVGIGVNSIASIPLMKKITSVTRTPTDTTIIETTIEKTTKKTISYPKGDIAHIINKKPEPTLVIKEQVETKEEISPQGFYATPMERRIPSAFILGIVVPASCGLIIFLVYASNAQIVGMGRYIATNIEPKINDLYFKNLPSNQKPIVWETYMQTLRFSSEEGKWVTGVFGFIAIAGSMSGFWIIGDIIIVVSGGILIVIVIVILLVLSKKIAKLRDGQGSLKKIWYQGIKEQNTDVKATRILWTKDIQYYVPLYQRVGSMIDDRDKAIAEIKDDSLKSTLETLGASDLAINKVQNTKNQMLTAGANTEQLLNQLINDLFIYLQNEEVKSTRILWTKDIQYITSLNEIIELIIDDKQLAIRNIINGSLKSRLETLGEFDLADKVQGTQRSMQGQGANKEDDLNKLINELFKYLLNRIKNWRRNPEYNPSFYFNLNNSQGEQVNNIPNLLELCIDNRSNFIQHLKRRDFELWLDNIGIEETELVHIARKTRETTFTNDNDRLHYFLRECCRVLIERKLYSC